ncbi:MAG: tyrosine-type recombinase/integrase [Deltaproteobacteria bacterium]|nr:tyrosine-type recombinase/integrase [Deltaproteobacteria bacterium]
MSIHQKKDGRWFVRIRDKESRRLIDKYFGRGIEAERQARDYNESLGLREWTRRTPKQQSPYFVELVNAYTSAKTGQIQPVSMQNLLYKLTGVILPTLGQETQAMNITAARLDKYVNKRLKTGVKRTTVHRELSDIRAILNWSVKRGYITRNPAAGFEMPERDDDIISPPTIEELNAIMANALPHLTRALALSYYTGLRPGGELYRISWNDLDCSNASLLVISAKKRGKPSRRVPIHQEFFGSLKRWYHEDIDAGLPDEMAIVNFNGQPVRSLKKAFNSAKAAAGITRRLRPYDLRHAFASSILAEGGDLKSTSEMLGHSRTGTTLRIYQHTNPTMHRAAVQHLPRLTIPENKHRSKGHGLKR